MLRSRPCRNLVRRRMKRFVVILERTSLAFINRLPNVVACSKRRRAMDRG